MAPPLDILIRDARLADAEAMAALRAASIRTLCSADHRGDADAIANWIGSPDKFLRLFEVPGTQMVVAEVDGRVAGLGAVYGDRVTLNYVHPDYRQRGVSKAVMRELEARLAASGVQVARLNSTVTALGFYTASHWIVAGPATSDGTPMAKRL